MPPDQRVPLTPEQCAEVLVRFPYMELAVQPSDVRRITDAEYTEAGVQLQEDLSDCDVLFGVKEVPVNQLIPEKTYFFFSHTYKLQPYNAKLLRACIDKKVRLIDYELLKRPGGQRIIGFGRYAGIVGTYNAFRTFGAHHGTYDLPRAIDCADRKEMEGHLAKVSLAPTTKIALTGHGRVGNGAREILEAMRIREVHPVDYLREDFGEPVFTHRPGGLQPPARGWRIRLRRILLRPHRLREHLHGVRPVDGSVHRRPFLGGRLAFLFTREDVRDEDWPSQSWPTSAATSTARSPPPWSRAPSPTRCTATTQSRNAACPSAPGFGRRHGRGQPALRTAPRRQRRLRRDAREAHHSVGGGGRRPGHPGGEPETNLAGKLTLAFAYLSEYAGLTGQ